MKVRGLRQSLVAQVLSPTQLVMHHLVSDAGLLIYCIRRAELDLWIGWLLALCDVPEQESHSPRLPATGRGFLQSGRLVEAQVALSTLIITNTSGLVSLPLALSGNQIPCTPVRGHTPSCSTATA